MTYTGEEVPVLGTLNVQAEYKGQSHFISLYVVKGNGSSLLGRDWLKFFRLDWKEICSLHLPTKLEGILKKYAQVFDPGLGIFQGLSIDIETYPHISPKFYKAQSVPFVYRDKIEKELDRLVQQGIISPVRFSKWAAPIVPVLKKCGSIRLCGDYKLTANTASPVDVYPLPIIEELFNDLSGGKQFTKLDLAQAYLQLPLSDSSKPLTTINTHKGLFQFNRMPFGISSAPAIFQRTMDNLLKGLTHVTVYLDDIVVTGSTEEEHLRNLEEVLRRLTEAGVHLKKDKCVFLASQVEYLGHLIDKDGLHPGSAKVEAVKDAPSPSNLSELRAFLGLINYYRKFIPNLSSELSLLYALLQKSSQWCWGPEEEECFKKAKALLASPSLLAHFDPTKQLILSCDASSVGVGAVLAHQAADGSSRPICYASRTLSPAEKKYSQLDKEALSIIFGVTKFKQYLFGRQFILFTDHKPLIYLFHPHRSVPPIVSARIQRWALILGAYSYEIRYRPGKEHGNADGLSRLPLPDSPQEVPVPEEVRLAVNELSKSLVTAKDIAKWTSQDPVLSTVLRYVTKGWPTFTTQTELQPYFSKRMELSIEDGCIFRGPRIVVPPIGRKAVLEEIHEAHPGICRMKSLARGYVWWPSIDLDLETEVKRCHTCQSVRHNPPAAPILPWTRPELPWSRIHVDFAGPFLGRVFLVIVDAHSKWLDVHMMSNTTSMATIEKLRSIFSIFGLPRVLVSDNAMVFTSTEFKRFSDENGIKHLTVAPYHPSCNGLAERGVQSFKEGMKKLTGPLETRLSQFLFAYRTTPQASTGKSPAALMFGRSLRTRLDLLFPNVAAEQVGKSQAQMMAKRGNRRVVSFKAGDLVYCRNFPSNQPRWVSAEVLDKTGPLSYRLTIPDGGTIRRHVDHIIPREGVTRPGNSSEDIPILPQSELTEVEPADETRGSPDAVGTSPVLPRRSGRVRQAPDRYQPSW